MLRKKRSFILPGYNIPRRLYRHSKEDCNMVGTSHYQRQVEFPECVASDVFQVLSPR